MARGALTAADHGLLLKPFYRMAQRAWRISQTHGIRRPLLTASCAVKLATTVQLIIPDTRRTYYCGWAAYGGDSGEPVLAIHTDATR